MGDGEAEVQLVVFRVGDGDEFALPIAQVQEVVRYAPPRSIASDVSWMRGVMSLRGVVLPVLDLASRLGLQVDGQPTRMLISASGPDNAQVAFAAGDVEEIAAVDDSAIEDAAGWHDAAVTGVAHIQDRIVVVLDADRLYDVPQALDASSHPVLEEQRP